MHKNTSHLRKVRMVVSAEYCWLIFSEGVVQGGKFMGIPGGRRPQMCETSSTSSPRCTLIEDRCFIPRLGTSGEGEKLSNLWISLGSKLSCITELLNTSTTLTT